MTLSEIEADLIDLAAETESSIYEGDEHGAARWRNRLILSMKALRAHADALKTERGRIETVRLEIKAASLLSNPPTHNQELLRIWAERLP